MANTMTPGWKPGYPPRGVSSKRLRPPKFDALRATAHELQRALTEGTLNSTDLVEEYVWRIEEHNTYLHAISEYAPGALERAKEMDLKRAAGEILGPLHGIPLILKVNKLATQYLSTCRLTIAEFDSDTSQPGNGHHSGCSSTRWIKTLRECICC